jgi:hypothetical protein
MFRRTAHRGTAALALVLLLAVAGAQPAAAADRSHTSHFAGFWSAVLDTIPGARAAQDLLNGLFHITEKSVPAPQDKTDQGWGIDPNGVVLDGAPVQPHPVNGG